MSVLKVFPSPSYKLLRNRGLSAPRAKRGFPSNVLAARAESRAAFLRSNRHARYALRSALISALQRPAQYDLDQGVDYFGRPASVVAGYDEYMPDDLVFTPPAPFRSPEPVSPAWRRSLPIGSPYRRLQERHLRAIQRRQSQPQDLEWYRRPWEAVRCLERKVRREVMFSLGLWKKGGRKPYHKWTPQSKVRC